MKAALALALSALLHAYGAWAAPMMGPGPEFSFSMSYGARLAKGGKSKGENGSDDMDGKSGKEGGRTGPTKATCTFKPAADGECVDSDMNRYSDFFQSRTDRPYQAGECQSICSSIAKPTFRGAQIGIGQNETYYCACKFDSPLPMMTPPGFLRFNVTGYVGKGPIAGNNGNPLAKCFEATCEYNNGTDSKSDKPDGSKSGKTSGSKSNGGTTNVNVDSKGGKDDNDGPVEPVCTFKPVLQQCRYKEIINNATGQSGYCRSASMLDYDALSPPRKPSGEIYTFVECQSECEQFEGLPTYRGFDFDTFDFSGCSCNFDDGPLPATPNGWSSDSSGGGVGPTTTAAFGDNTYCFAYNCDNSTAADGECVDSDLNRYADFYKSRTDRPYQAEECQSICSSIAKPTFRGVQIGQNLQIGYYYCGCKFDSPLPMMTPPGFLRFNATGYVGKGPIAGNDGNPLAKCFEATCEYSNSSTGSKSDKSGDGSGGGKTDKFGGGKGGGDNFDTCVFANPLLVLSSVDTSSIHFGGNRRSLVRDREGKRQQNNGGGGVFGSGLGIDIGDWISSTSSEETTTTSATAASEPIEAASDDPPKTEATKPATTTAPEQAKPETTAAPNTEATTAATNGVPTPDAGASGYSMGGGSLSIEHDCSDGCFDGLDSGLAGFLQHNNNVNMLYSEAVSAWINDGASPDDIIKMGMAASHQANCTGICYFAFALIEQMEDTCNWNKYRPGYANAAACFMSGFSRGKSRRLRFGGSDPTRLLATSGVNILKCEYNGKTFEKMYGKLLTEATMNAIDMGETCSM